MDAWFRSIADDARFQAFVLLVILANAVFVGLETSPALVAANASLFAVLNAAITLFFVIEITIRVLAFWPRPLAFFRDGWNVFDFVIVAVSLVPAVGTFATVARLARLLRVVRLVSYFPELRLMVGTMLRSLVSMGHVLVLLSLVVYVYGVLGYHLFHRADPEHWRDLGTSLLTLFGTLTLEGWLEVQAATMSAHPLAWLFYASYIILAVFIVVNLFIAVILNNLETVKAEERAELLEAATAAERVGGIPDPLASIERLRAELDVLETEVRAAGRAEPA